MSSIGKELFESNQGSLMFYSVFKRKKWEAVYACSLKERYKQQTVL